jgi:hypothetical protein
MRQVQRNKLSPAQKAWLGLFGYIVIADAYLMRRNKDTMSIQFGHWLQHPRHRKLCVGVTGLIIAHLYYSTPLPFQKRFRLLVTVPPVDLIESLALQNEESLDPQG